MAFDIPRNSVQSAYQRGYDDGREGYPLQFRMGPAGAQYKDGWYNGYRDELSRCLSEYNAANGTNWEPRI